MNLNHLSSKTIMGNPLILFCLCLMFLGCGSNTPFSTLPKTSNPIEGSTSSENSQESQENQETRTCNSPTRNDFISNDDIQMPQSEGEYVKNCHDNPNYNACIYHHDPFTQNGLLIPEFKNIFNGQNNMRKFNEAMRSYQNYAVNIRGTTHGLLKNEHYDVKIPNSYGIRLNQQPNEKWTMPYAGFETYNVSTSPNQRFSVEQVMAYYYLMYQKEWMELNTGQWYASGKNISVTFSENTYWDKYSNKINLKTSEYLGSFQVSGSMHAGVTVHEAGHANFYYSNLSREGSKNKAAQECKFSFATYSDKCCASADGCFNAIDEGQADFYALMIFPDFPLEFSLEEYINALIENPGIKSPVFDDSGNCKILRDPRANKNLKAEEAFNCSNEQTQEGDTRGEIHDMGKLYASIWWELYNHPETSKKDIAILFSTHLLLVSYDDTFKTMAVKIINKAKDLFGELKGEHYACIISQEFARRGLGPSS